MAFLPLPGNESLLHSFLQTEYRNKCEFLVGVGVDGEDNTVGCRLGKYKGGTCAVASPFDTVHIPDAAKQVVKAFQEFIRWGPCLGLGFWDERMWGEGTGCQDRQPHTEYTCGFFSSTPYSAYDPETYTGHWKQLTVRTSRRGQAMAIAYFHPQVSGGGPVGVCLV